MHRSREIRRDMLIKYWWICVESLCVDMRHVQRYLKCFCWPYTLQSVRKQNIVGSFINRSVTKLFVGFWF